MKIFSNKNRPVHLGPYPLERLARCEEIPALAAVDSMEPMQVEIPDQPLSMSNAFRDYINFFDRVRSGEAAERKAPVPDSIEERSRHLKAAAYFLDASMVGICRIDSVAVLKTPLVNESLLQAEEREYAAGSADNAMAQSSVKEGRETWARTADDNFNLDEQSFALVILVEHTRDIKADEPGAKWLMGTQKQRAAVRAAEVAAVLSNYIRFLGFEAGMHTHTASDLSLDHLVLASGLGEIEGSNGATRITNPYLGGGYSVAVVSTSMELQLDKPLARRDGLQKLKSHGPGWWLGSGGARPGFKGRLFDNRPFHLGPYPMETVKRVEEPTTLIDRPNVPRIPKRHDMFIRAALGDLGSKPQNELDHFRMITKSPFGHALVPPLGGMVPLQYGKEAGEITPGTESAQDNSDAIKAALYFLGADMVGICELPEYAWYSHDTDGSEIKPYHKYGIAVLIDQGHETMEGASGDDWISGAQSMRAYMRAQLIGGIVGAHIRNLGYSARGHSVMDQDVLHIPTILESGLGELSRIGELVLNPFVGPRFKSGVITTDMPLIADKPIDFGLQDFCQKCTKCARECPCTAIPLGDKIMFNGYEIWKPDVEKCAKYRITNSAGSMCGRCMKTCPWNIEGVLSEWPFLKAAMHLPFTREWIAKLDDKVANGTINPVKKWWWDMDTNEKGEIVMASKSNERQLTFHRNITAEKQSMACYPADIASPPLSETPVTPDRKEGRKRYKEAIKPEKYRASM